MVQQEKYGKSFFAWQKIEKKQKKKTKKNTVNSFMFAGINVCIFETKPCLRGLIFVVS